MSITDLEYLIHRYNMVSDRCKPRLREMIKCTMLSLLLTNNY